VPEVQAAELGCEGGSLEDGPSAGSQQPREEEGREMSGWIRDAPMLSTGIPSRRAGSVDQFPVWGACGSGVIGIIEFWRVRGGGRGYQNGGPPFANLSPRLSLFSDHLRTVLAVKGSLRRAQQRRALDGSGPFRTTLLRRGKGSLRTAPLAGDHFAAILVPFFSATDTVED
jgi:hypothetical protein